MTMRLAFTPYALRLSLNNFQKNSLPRKNNCL
jgi:hypothetical protein